MASIGLTVMKMAANSMATSCMGAQVKAFSMRIDGFVVFQERKLIASRTLSRTKPFTGISMPSPIGIVVSRCHTPLTSTVLATAAR